MVSDIKLHFSFLELFSFFFFLSYLSRGLSVSLLPTESWVSANTHVHHIFGSPVINLSFHCHHFFLLFLVFFFLVLSLQVIELKA